MCLRCVRWLGVLLLLSASATAQTDIQVLGSTVLTAPDGSEGPAITYLIRFQNPRADTAYHVVVRDTLDPRLDAATLTVLAASHPYHMVKEANQVVRWYFEDIRLSPTTPGSSGAGGFILFSVRLRPFVAPGQTITNHSCVTFNHQTTRCTNQAIVWVESAASSLTPQTDDANSGWLVVPSPNYGVFEVRPSAQRVELAGSTPAQWWVTDLSGRTVWQGTGPASAALPRPSPGMYHLWVREAGQMWVRPFLVVK